VGLVLPETCGSELQIANDSALRSPAPGPVLARLAPLLQNGHVALQALTEASAAAAEAAGLSAGRPRTGAGPAGYLADTALAMAGLDLGKEIWVVLGGAPAWWWPFSGLPCAWYPAARTLSLDHPAAWRQLEARLGDRCPAGAARPDTSGER
jgi:hypothetical protein